MGELIEPGGEGGIRTERVNGAKGPRDGKRIVQPAGEGVGQNSVACEGPAPRVLVDAASISPFPSIGRALRGDRRDP